jgi:Rrf2 family protein
MLQLTKRTEYGLIALVHMVDREGGFVSVREISEPDPVPRLKDLCRASLVESQRGATGGYALARAAEVITLGEVVSALEGPPRLASCESLVVADEGECSLEPVCPIRSPLHRIREGIWHLMERTTLRSLVRPRAGVSELALLRDSSLPLGEPADDQLSPAQKNVS